MKRKQLELLSWKYLTKAVFSLKGGIFFKAVEIPTVGKFETP